MSIKDRLLVLTVLLIFSVGVFGYPYLVEWLHSDEGTITMKAFFFVIGVFVGIGIVAFHADIVYKIKKDLEKIDEIADNLEYRKNAIEETLQGTIITAEEIKQNAESYLTYDEKAHLRMMRNNPHFKINTKA